MQSAASGSDTNGPPAAATDVASGLRGSAQIAAGLVIGGVATMLMVAVASRTLPERQFAAFVTWWLTVTLLAPVVGAFEVYITRNVLILEQGGTVASRMLGQMSGLALAGVVLLTALVLPMSPWLADTAFSGVIWAPLTIPLVACGVVLQSLQRGAAAGRRRFSVVGVQLSVDGVLRVLLASLALLSGRDSAVYAAPVLASLLSVAAAAPMMRRWLFRPSWRHRVVELAPLGWLMVAATGPVLLGNAVSPWFAAQMASDAALVGGFAAALTLSRVPTQLASAAFSPALAHMSVALDQGDVAGFRRSRRVLSAWVAGLGAAFVVSFLVLGHLLLGLYIGSTYEVPNWVLGLLALASAGLLFAAIQQAALTAQQRWGTIALAWVVGSVTFVLSLIPDGVSALTRATVAPLLGVAAATAVMMLAPASSRSDRSSDA